LLFLWVQAQDNSAATAGGFAAIDASSSLTFSTGGANVFGSVPDALVIVGRIDTPNPETSQPGGQVACGRQTWATTPNNLTQYTIFGPMCACADAFAAGTATSCDCRAQGLVFDRDQCACLVGGSARVWG
jgi:hypothetical protein